MLVKDERKIKQGDVAEMGWRRWGDFVILNKVNKIELHEMIFLRKKSGSEFCRYLGEDTRSWYLARYQGEKGQCKGPGAGSHRVRRPRGWRGRIQKR